MPNITKTVNEKVVFTASTPIIPAPLMCIVTKQQQVGVGQCFRKDLTAQLTSIAFGKSTKINVLNVTNYHCTVLRSRV